MNRLQFLRLAFLGLIGSMVYNPASATMAQNSGAGKAPNIILIISDDQGYADIGCAGTAKDVSTPNLDRLASRGIRFTNGYATSPVCSPSRAGLLTGCYQERFGVYYFGGKGMCDPNYKTLGDVCKEAGYATGYLGKFHYGGDNVHVPGNHNFPTQHGFDYFYGFAGGRKHYLIHNAEEQKKHLQAIEKHSTWKQSLMKDAFWVNDKKVDQEGFSTELLGTEARKFINKNKDNKFFLTLAFNAVHNFAHQLPKEYLEKHNLPGYHDWDPEKEEYYEWYKKGRNPNDPFGRAYYLGQLYYLDKEVGKLLDYLTEMGLQENTVIIYVSDNGGSVTDFANNGSLRGGKYTLYEGGIRTHFMASWPGKFLEKKTLPNVVSHMDILPTICALTGAKNPGSLDGVDLSPLLTGKDMGIHHETLVWDTKIQTAVKDGKWKYRMANSEKDTQLELMELELGEYLYDLENDPGEKVNLIEKYPDVAKQLKEKYAQWKKYVETK